MRPPLAQADNCIRSSPNRLLLDWIGTCQASCYVWVASLEFWWNQNWLICGRKWTKIFGVNEEYYFIIPGIYVAICDIYFFIFLYCLYIALLVSINKFSLLFCGIGSGDDFWNLVQKNEMTVSLSIDFDDGGVTMWEITFPNTSSLVKWQQIVHE